MDTPTFLSDRSRVGWWLLTGVLLFVLSFTALELIGPLVLGLFLYYGTRPIYRYVETVVDSDGLAAVVTVFIIALPVLVLLGVLLAVGLQQLTAQSAPLKALVGQYVDVGALTSQPVSKLLSSVRGSGGGGSLVSTATGYLGGATQALSYLFVALLVGFYLLKDGDRIAGWFRSEVDVEGAAYAYASAVDQDLETVFFSNVLLVFIISGLSFVVYHGYNLVAPSSVAIPLPTVMALLTGFAGLIPLVAGKVVYVPLVGYLAVSGLQAGPASLLFPAALLAVAFVVLDFVPLTFLLPALAGRSTDMGIVMFAYILGVMVFGWYGLFLGPLVAVLTVQLVRIVFSELVHGRQITPAVRAGEDIGSDPRTPAGSDD